jgi:hypothetical protein
MISKIKIGYTGNTSGAIAIAAIGGLATAFLAKANPILALGNLIVTIIAVNSLLETEEIEFSPVKEV